MLCVTLVADDFEYEEEKRGVFVWMPYFKMDVGCICGGAQMFLRGLPE